jgi:hypothetical protein
MIKKTVQTVMQSIHPKSFVILSGQVYLKQIFALNTSVIELHYKSQTDQTGDTLLKLRLKIIQLLLLIVVTYL